MKPDKRYTRKEGFFMIQNDIFKIQLDPYAFSIYAYLVSRAGQNGECWPSIPAMSRELHISQTTVQDRLRLLEKLRFIKKQHVGGYADDGSPRTFNNHYHILDFEKAWNYHFFEHKKQLELERHIPLDEDIDF